MLLPPALCHVCLWMPLLTLVISNRFLLGCPSLLTCVIWPLNVLASPCDFLPFSAGMFLQLAFRHFAFECPCSPFWFLTVFCLDVPSSCPLSFCLWMPLLIRVISDRFLLGCSSLLPCVMLLVDVLAYPCDFYSFSAWMFLLVAFCHFAFARPCSPM